jgi:hypothetical protein
MVTKEVQHRFHWQTNRREQLRGRSLCEVRNEGAGVRRFIVEARRLKSEHLIIATSRVTCTALGSVKAPAHVDPVISLNSLRMSLVYILLYLSFF